MCLRYTHIFNIGGLAACLYAAVNMLQLMEKTDNIREWGILLECYPCVNKRGWGEMLLEKKADSLLYHERRQSIRM